MNSTLGNSSMTGITQTRNSMHRAFVDFRNKNQTGELKIVRPQILIYYMEGVQNSVTFEQILINCLYNSNSSNTVGLITSLLISIDRDNTHLVLKSLEQSALTIEKVLIKSESLNDYTSLIKSMTNNHGNITVTTWPKGMAQAICCVYFGSLGKSLRVEYYDNYITARCKRVDEFMTQNGQLMNSKSNFFPLKRVGEFKRFCDTNPSYCYQVISIFMRFRESKNPETAIMASQVTDITAWNKLTGAKIVHQFLWSSDSGVMVTPELKSETIQFIKCVQALEAQPKMAPYLGFCLSEAEMIAARINTSGFSNLYAVAKAVGERSTQSLKRLFISQVTLSDEKIQKLVQLYDDTLGDLAGASTDKDIKSLIGSENVAYAEKQLAIKRQIMERKDKNYEVDVNQESSEMTELAS